MKNLTKILFGGIILTFSMASCNSEDVVLEEEESPIVPTEFLNITYQGHTYKSVPTAYDENGDFIFLDEEFSKVYQENISTDQDWSIAIKGDNDIEFYSDLNENLKANGIDIDPNTIPTATPLSNQSTRGSYENLAELRLFDDKNYGDTNLFFALNDSTISIEVRNLKKDGYHFGDKCSSLKLTNNMPNDPNQTFKLGAFTYPCSNIDAVFIGYEDKKLGKSTITCIAHPTDDHKHSSLPGFNDKLSSFQFFFAQRDHYHCDI